MKETSLSYKIYYERVRVKEIRKALDRLLERWKLKCDRMDIMGKDCAYYELKTLVYEEFGDKLI